MRVTAAIAIDARARRAWPWLPAVAPVGAVLVGPTAEVLVVREDGGTEEVSAVPLRKSIAADPCPGRRGV